MKTRFSLVLLLLIPGMAGAFEVKYAPEISSTAFLRWNVSKGPINMTLNSAGSDDLLTGDVEKAVTRALLAWESISRQQIRFQYDGRNSIAVVNNSDNINSIVWEENDWDYADTSLAVTTYSYYLGDPPQVVDTDIQFNGRDFHWSVNGQNDEKAFDVQQVLMHELGHLLGLAHSSVVNASLYPYVGREIRHKLSLDDRSGLRFLYGQNIADFRSITPVNKAAYVEGMSRQGLPLPVFRWSGLNRTDFKLEFSDTPSFDRTISWTVGSENFYPLKPSQERKLLKLSSEKKIYWRVTSKGETTKARLLQFKPAP